MNSSLKRKKIVVIGGGTGSSVVLTGLKHYPIDLCAIISVADSGGSTGRLRDEFGFQAVGDLRQALASLAGDGDQTWIRDLLLYRFSKGEGLEGHNLGNLILTALQDMTGSTAKALEIASQIFRLHGSIYPSTTQKVELVVEYFDGSFIIGEHHLNPENLGGKKIKKVMLSPKATAYTKARRSLENSDIIIIGPGDLYASIMPNLVVSGMISSFKKTKAKVIYIMNLMTVYTQTANLTANNHLEIIEKAIGRQVDYVVINNAPIPKSILKVYLKQHETPVIDDINRPLGVIRKPLITQTKILRQLTKDKLVRSFLRHDPASLATIIMSI